MARSNGKPASRALLGAGIAAVIVVALHFLPKTTVVLLLIFAGVLFGILLDGLARLISRALRLGHRAALTVVIAVLFGIAFLFVWLAGPRIAQQTAALVQQLPGSVEAIRSELMHYDWGRAVLSQLPPTAQIRWPIETMLGQISGLFSITLGTLAAIIFIFFVALYLAADSNAYIGPLMLLLPKSRRRRGKAVVAAVGSALRWWLLGRAVAMTVIGGLTWIALSLVNVPLALALGVISALLVFVPYIGAIIAAIPAMLLALMQDPIKALWVALIYTGIHVFEGYCITPLIQQRTVSLPPALLLCVQVVIGALYGPVGIFLATPLAVCAIVLIQMLYVEDILEEEVEVLGTH